MGGSPIVGPQPAVLPAIAVLDPQATFVKRTPGVQPLGTDAEGGVLNAEPGVLAQAAFAVGFGQQVEDLRDGVKPDPDPGANPGLIETALAGDFARQLDLLTVHLQDAAKRIVGARPILLHLQLLEGGADDLGIGGNQLDAHALAGGQHEVKRLPPVHLHGSECILGSAG